MVGKYSDFTYTSASQMALLRSYRRCTQYELDFLRSYYPTYLDSWNGAVVRMGGGVAEEEPRNHGEAKAWYLEMISAQLESLPEGPYKDEVNAALRQMVSRMVTLEEAIDKAKAAKERSLVEKEAELKAKEKEKAEKEAELKAKTEKETPTGDTAASAASASTPSLLSSQLAPQP